jgi:hypothetical protein
MVTMAFSTYNLGSKKHLKKGKKKKLDQGFKYQELQW